MTNIPLNKSKLADALGITRQTIHTWEKRGDLVFDKTRKMSVDEFNRQLGSKLHPRSKIKKEKYTPISNEINTEEKNEDIDLDYHAARTIREIAEARTAEFKLEVLRGDYLAFKLAEKIMFERARACRDALMTSAKRNAPLLAGKKDIADIEEFLVKEYRMILDQFSKMPLFND